MLLDASAGLTSLVAYLCGAAVVLVVLLLSVTLGHSWRFWKLAEGQDGRLSLSKAQWLAWTVVVAFGFVATYVALAVNGDQNALPSLPANVLIAMGFSATTVVTAKGLTSFYVAQGRVVKPAPPAATPPAVRAAPAPGASPAPAAATPPGYYSDLLVDDTNQPDLSRMQLLIWTLIALGVFVGNVVSGINGIAQGGTVKSLPDIDGTFMVLTGLSQGGYLGKKLVTASPLRLFSLAPPSVAVAAGTAPLVTVVGSGFGAPLRPGGGDPEDPQSMLLVDGHRLAARTWSDTRISFAVDLTSIPSLAGPVASPVTLAVTVMVAGQLPVDPTTHQQQDPLNLTVTRG